MSDALLVDEERARLRALERTNRLTVRRVTTVDVDPDAVTATVDPGDGRAIVVYPVDGTLPAKGDVVTAFKVGDDWFITGGTLLAQGSRQSIGFTPGSDGWGQDADGNFEANNGTFRGTVAAAEFTTSEDTDDPRVVISSADDARTVLLYSGDDEELLPGALTSFVDGTRQVVRLRGGEFEAGGAGKHASVDVGIDPDTGGTFGECLADDWRVNGVSISTPPYSSKRRVAPLGPIAPDASAAQAILWDTDLLVNFESDISYDASTGLFSIKAPGIYTTPLIWAWNDSAQPLGDGGRRVRIEQQGQQRTIDTRVGVGGGDVVPANGTNTVHNCSAEVIVPSASETSPYTVRFFAGHTASASLTGTGRVAIRRVSG